MTPDGRRQAVAHLCEAHGVSQRRACCVLQADRSSVRYNSKRIDDAEQREAIKRISKERRRLGYRRINVMLQREGIHMNHKKLRRIYAEEKLKVRRRGGRKRALGTRRRKYQIGQTNVGAWISCQMHSQTDADFVF